MPTIAASYNISPRAEGTNAIFRFRHYAGDSENSFLIWASLYITPYRQYIDFSRMVCYICLQYFISIMQLPEDARFAFSLFSHWLLLRSRRRRWYLFRLLRSTIADARISSARFSASAAPHLRCRLVAAAVDQPPLIISLWIYALLLFSLGWHFLLIWFPIYFDGRHFSILYRLSFSVIIFLAFRRLFRWQLLCACFRYMFHKVSYIDIFVIDFIMAFRFHHLNSRTLFLLSDGGIFFCCSFASYFHTALSHQIIASSCLMLVPPVMQKWILWNFDWSHRKTYIWGWQYLCLFIIIWLLGLVKVCYIDMWVMPGPTCSFSKTIISYRGLSIAPSYLTWRGLVDYRKPISPAMALLRFNNLLLYRQAWRYYFYACYFIITTIFAFSYWFQYSLLYTHLCNRGTHALLRFNAATIFAFHKNAKRDMISRIITLIRCSTHISRFASAFDIVDAMAFARCSRRRIDFDE